MGVDLDCSVVDVGDGAGDVCEGRGVIARAGVVGLNGGQDDRFLA